MLGAASSASTRKHADYQRVCASRASDWHPEAEKAPLTRCAVNIDPALVVFDSRSHDRQAQPLARNVFYAGLLHAVKRLKQLFLLRKGNTDSIVLNFKCDLGFSAIVFLINTDHNLAARWSVFDRILDQVEDGMPQ